MVISFRVSFLQRRDSPPRCDALNDPADPQFAIAPGGVQLRSAENPLGDPGVDAVEHRGKGGEEIGVRPVDGEHQASDQWDDQAPREGALVKAISAAA